MTLRDALATAEHKATGQSTGSIGDPIDLCAHAFGMRACVVRADAILADPALRVALTEAVAEAINESRVDLEEMEHHESVFQAGVRAIVARMLGEPLP